MTSRFKRFCSIALGIGAMLAGFGQQAQAQFVFPPLGLGPSAHFRVIFTSADTVDAISPLITAYNAFGVVEANLPGSFGAGLTTTWTAVASTSLVDAINNINFGGISADPIYNTHGQLVATSGTAAAGGLFSGAISNVPLYNQYGGGAAADVWTGTAALGGVGAAGAQLGTLNAAGPEVGRSDETGTFLFARNTAANLGYTTSSLLRIYVISGELTNVPEPGTFALMGAVSLVGLGFRRWRRKNGSAEAVIVSQVPSS